jgi:hypothetical protein
MTVYAVQPTVSVPDEMFSVRGSGRGCDRDRMHHWRIATPDINDSEAGPEGRRLQGYGYSSNRRRVVYDPRPNLPCLKLDLVFRNAGEQNSNDLTPSIILRGRSSTGISESGSAFPQPTFSLLPVDSALPRSPLTFKLGVTHSLLRWLCASLRWMAFAYFAPLRFNPAMVR